MIKMEFIPIILLIDGMSDHFFLHSFVIPPLWSLLLLLLLLPAQRVGVDPQPLSRVTAGAAEDMWGPGTVDYSKADVWTCPPQYDEELNAGSGDVQDLRAAPGPFDDISFLIPERIANLTPEQIDLLNRLKTLEGPGMQRK